MRNSCLGDMGRSDIPAIEIRELCKTYTGKKRTPVEALKNISLSIAPGEVFGFLGPNGAGKSTTIKCLIGLIRPTSGHTYIMGENAVLVSAHRRVGYLPENPSFYDYLSAEEFLRFVGISFQLSRNQLTNRCEEVLTLLGLWEARKRPMRGYSKGMVQRVGLAQVLLHDPDVYILDEPMSGLDPIGRALVKNIINTLKARGKSVFFSTHITSDIESICDRVGIIYKGELRAVERVDKIIAEEVTGYRIQVKKTSGEIISQSVSKENFQGFMSSVTNEGDEVWLVEPDRKHLEEFFLRTVGYDNLAKLPQIE